MAVITTVMAGPLIQLIFPAKLVDQEIEGEPLLLLGAGCWGAS